MKKPKKADLAKRLRQWYIDGEAHLVALAPDNKEAVQKWHRKGRTRLESLLEEL